MQQHEITRPRFPLRTLEIVLLLAITLLAAALRFYQLGEWSFWADEVFTIGSRQDDFNLSPWRRSLALSLIRATTQLLGTDEWNARLVPALIGVLTIPALYLLLRRIVGARAALVSSLLLALSPWHLYWSQNARFYSLLLLFYTLALLALFLVPVIVSYLGLLYLLPVAKPAGLRWRNLLIFFGPGALVSLLVAGRYLRNLEGWMSGGFGSSNNSPFWLAAGVAYYVGLPLICMAAAAALYFLSRGQRVRPPPEVGLDPRPPEVGLDSPPPEVGLRAALLFSLGAGMPLLLLMAIAPFHYTANRYVFVTLTSWIVLAAMGVVALWNELPAQRRMAHSQVLALAPLLILVAYGASENLLYFRYQHGNRDNWRAAFEFIQQHQDEEDRVVAAHKNVGDYYMQAKTIALANFDPASIAEHCSRVWFVEDMMAASLSPQKVAWVKKHSREMADFDVHVHARTFKMRVYLYVPAEQDCRPLHFEAQSP
jgi:mannosyltransferase